LGPTDRHPTRLGGEVGGRERGSQSTPDASKRWRGRNQRAAEVEPGIRHGEDGGAGRKGGSLVGNGATGGADEKIFAGEEQLRLRTAKRRGSGERKRAIGRTEGRQKGRRKGRGRERERERGREGRQRRREAKKRKVRWAEDEDSHHHNCLHSTLHNDLSSQLHIAYISDISHVHYHCLITQYTIRIAIIIKYKPSKLATILPERRLVKYKPLRNLALSQCHPHIS
jgi:hypothetical protein